MRTLRTALFVCSLACADRADRGAATCDTGPDTGFQIGEIDPGCRCAPPEVQVGTGETAFEALLPGQDLTLIHGPQNGWHLPGAVRVSNTRDVVTLELSVWWQGARITPTLSSRVLLLPEQPCAYILPNLFLYLDTTGLSQGEADTPPELLACEDVDIRMCAEDSGGRGECAERTVRAVPDAMDVESGLAAACP